MRRRRQPAYCSFPPGKEQYARCRSVMWPECSSSQKCLVDVLPKVAVLYHRFDVLLFRGKTSGRPSFACLIQAVRTPVHVSKKRKPSRHLVESSRCSHF